MALGQEMPILHNSPSLAFWNSTTRFYTIGQIKLWNSIMAAKKGSERNKGKGGAFVSVTTEKDVQRFKKSAQTYTTHVTSSKQSARDALTSLGIYTKTGRLSSKYK